MPKDACYKKVKRRVKVFPSARASQQIAKCRKAKGKVRKTKAGTSLKRWKDEKWEDTRTGKPCGKGGKNEYCRPTKRVSKKTPKTKSEMSKSQLTKKKAEKRKVGMGRRVKPVRRKWCARTAKRMVLGHCAGYVLPRKRDDPGHNVLSSIYRLWNF